MNFNSVKKKIEEYRDFYGQDVIFISKPKSIADCEEALRNHHRFLEMQNIDALNHLEEFMRNIGLA